MIKLLAPQSQSEVDAGATILLEMDRSALLGLRAAVEVAYDDPEATPAEYVEAGAELWRFFVKGEQEGGDLPFVA